MFKKLIRKITQQDKIEELNKQIEFKDKDIIYLKEQLIKAQKEIAFKTTEEQRENYWNNLKPKYNGFTYNARYDNLKFKYDIRNLVYTKSYVLEDLDIVRELRNSNLSDDEKAIAVLKWVHNNISYKGDFSVSKVEEYWNDPETCVQLLEGDCEDGGILIASLLRILGIPAYKVEVYTGYVQDPKNPKGKVGHAFCVYLAEDDKYYILDWCYFFEESLKNFKKLSVDENPKYKEEWWSFNDQFIWKLN